MLGIGQMQSDATQLAIDSWKEALDLSFGNRFIREQIFTNLGQAYHELGDHERSDQAFEKALKLDPDNALILNNFAYFLAERGQNLSKALEMTIHSNKIDPDNPTYLDTWAWVLYQNAQYQEALLKQERALALLKIRRPTCSIIMATSSFNLERQNKHLRIGNRPWNWGQNIQRRSAKRSKRMKWRNKAHLSVACLLLLFACGPKKPLVQSPDISEGASDLSCLLSTHAFRPNELKVEARAILQETDTRTEFNLEIRLRHDSLVWMQLSDPFLGFPLMRAVISAERFAMVNRLEGTYFEGDARGLQRLLGMSLPFQLLQAVLLGNFPTDVSLFIVNRKTRRQGLPDPFNKPTSRWWKHSRHLLFLGDRPSIHLSFEGSRVPRRGLRSVWMVCPIQWVSLPNRDPIGGAWQAAGPPGSEHKKR